MYKNCNCCKYDDYHAESGKTVYGCGSLGYGNAKNCDHFKTHWFFFILAKIFRWK